MVIENPGRALKMLGRPAADPKTAYETARKEFRTTLNLVWLEPFGFQDAGVARANTPAFAAPIVRKDTLNKFPALPRVISKLSGKVDNGVMTRLITEGGGNGKTKKATRKFLKDNKLI